MRQKPTPFNGRSADPDTEVLVGSGSSFFMAVRSGSVFFLEGRIGIRVLSTRIRYPLKVLCDLQRICSA